MSKFYEQRGKLDKAEALHVLALSIMEKQFGPEHRNVGTSLRDLAEMYNVQGRGFEAEQARLRSEQILSKKPAIASESD